MQMVEPDADMSTTDHNLNLLEPFENMDSLRYFSNMVYVHLSIMKVSNLNNPSPTT